MCYVCNCFAWTLDLVQRILTFCLSCWLAFAVCCGLSIAAIAGIAYGYNYCLAEYITLTRSDIRIYMRRGQFYDKPDLMRSERRMGDDDDVFPYNLTVDYLHEIQTNDSALAAKWIKDKEIRKYAEKLTKYSKSRKTMSDANEQDEQNDDTNYKSGKHTATTILHSSSSDIVMRLFETVTDKVKTIEQTYIGKDFRVNKALDEALRKNTADEDKDMPIIEVDDSLRSKQMKMRYWKPTHSINSEYSTDVDDIDVIYRNV